MSDEPTAVLIVPVKPDITMQVVDQMRSVLAEYLPNHRSLFLGGIEGGIVEVKI